MIISHRHRFIYIKTYKTASTSIEAALAAVCGPDDVITPTRADLMQAREGQRAQNFRLRHPLVPKRPMIRRLLGRPERHYHPSVGYYEHMPASRVRAYVGEEVWNSYFKFSFERNPWDRQVSWYHYKIKDKGKTMSFARFMADRRRAYVDNYDLYSDQRQIILDYVGRYETLSEDFRHVLSRVGLSDRVELPRVNVSVRQGDYRSFYDDAAKALIENWYRREIDHFGYRF